MEQNHRRWDLRDLYADVEETVLDLEHRVDHLASSRSNLSPDTSTEDFLQLLNAYEGAACIQRRLAAYAFLRFAEDTQDSAALSLQNRVNQLLADTENRLVFLELWFKGLPEDTAARLIASSGDRHYFLESWRRFKPFTLSEPEERIITLKDVNGIDAMVTLYDMITSAFSFQLELDGQPRTLTQPELTALVRDPSAEVRAAAYKELYRVYMQNRALLAQIYHCRVRDWHAEVVSLRHFAEPIAARNTMNDIPDQVVQTILNVCRENVALFQRYFRAKAKWLHQDRLRRYDIYAPLAASEKSLTLREALALVLDSFGGFATTMEEQARRVLEANHLDALPRQHKRSGAFCYSVLPELTPWVLVNYTGRSRDVSTLAHELGHAVHAMQAEGHSALTYDASDPLAETASVFGEMLLSERLLARASDGAARGEILAGMLDDAFATVQRQAFFTLFERDAHKMAVEGATAEDLATHYLGNLREQFGSAVDVSDEFQWEWLLIPHFYHTPFYTYAYAFGQLLVLALFQRYRLEGESFVPKYLGILSAGGSASPASILAEAGIDVATPAFWQGGFDLIASWIDQLEVIQAR